ncbi:MAG: hypothetical protein AB1499_09555 [Nitrospirota bacterium]
MKDDLLSEVVKVEKELARVLEKENEGARKMLVDLRKDSDRSISEEKKQLQEALNQAITASDIRAEKKASDIMEKADATASRLERTGDDLLKEIIRKHITRILP